MPKFLDKDAGIPLLISLEMILGECFFLSLYKSASLSVSESVWMFVPITPPKRRTPAS